VSRFLYVFKPIAGLIPQVKRPERKLSFKERVIRTFVFFIIYFVMSNIPLYGIETSQGFDPFYAVRVLLASNRGTLTELGIGPIVTAGLVMQILVGARLIQIDVGDPEQRALYTVAQKALAIFFTIFESILYIVMGAYGTLTFSQKVLVVVQLTAAGIVIILMDEAIQRGRGIGSGLSLFILGGVAGTVLRSSLSPIKEADGMYQGALLALIQAAFGSPTVSDAMLRPGYPDGIGLISTFFIIALVLYANLIKVEIPVRHQRYKIPAKYPIKLMYTENIPVILIGAFVSQAVFFLSYIRRKRNPNNENPALNILGTFTYDAHGNLVPTGGLAYYITPPRGVTAVMDDPLRAIIYFIILSVLGAVFSITRIEIGGMSPRAVAEQLLKAELVIPGIRATPKQMERYLKRYIPQAALIGGIIIGALSAIADFLGAFSTGSGLLLATSITIQLLDIMTRERVADLHPRLARILGITS